MVPRLTCSFSSSVVSERCRSTGQPNCCTTAARAQKCQLADTHSNGATQKTRNFSQLVVRAACNLVASHWLAEKDLDARLLQCRLGCVDCELPIRRRGSPVCSNVAVSTWLSSPTASQCERSGALAQQLRWAPVQEVRQLSLWLHRVQHDQLERVH